MVEGDQAAVAIKNHHPIINRFDGIDQQLSGFQPVHSLLFAQRDVLFNSHHVPLPPHGEQRAVKVRVSRRRETCLRPVPDRRWGR